MSESIYDGYVFVLQSNDDMPVDEYYLSPHREPATTTLIDPDGGRHSPVDVATNLGHDESLTDWDSYCTPIPVGDAPPDVMQMFSANAVERYIEAVRHSLRISCPGCGTNLVGVDTVTGVIRDYKFEILSGAATGGIAPGLGALAGVIFKILHENGERDKIVTHFGLEKREQGISSQDEYACKSCGVTVYP